MDELVKLGLGEKITVQTEPGRENKPIGHLPDGRVILFDQKSQYYNALAPGQSVEGHVIVISENYIIVSPIRDPKVAEAEPAQEACPDEIVEELEKLVGEDFDEIIVDLENLVRKVSKNAKIIPRALIHVIRLQHLIIKILTRENKFSRKS